MVVVVFTAVVVIFDILLKLNHVVVVIAIYAVKTHCGPFINTSTYYSVLSYVGTVCINVRFVSGIFHAGVTVLRYSLGPKLSVTFPGCGRRQFRRFLLGHACDEGHWYVRWSELLVCT